MAVITDAFVNLGFATEKVLDRLVGGEVEMALQQQLKALFPSAYASVSQVLEQNRSIHVDHLPLMNPLHVGILIATYLSIVFGGKWLTQLWLSPADKPNVGILVKAHNLFLLALSMYMALNVGYEAFVNRGYSLFNNPSEEVHAARGLSKALWLFYFSKVFEFMDTFIMVLKQNWRQISFLHLYHHASIFAVWWLTIFVAPTGEAYFSAILNSLIHVVMYGYYFLSACGYGKPEKKDVISQMVKTVKPYITLGQMTQFCCMMFQATYDISMATVFQSPGDARSQLPLHSQRLQDDGTYRTGTFAYPLGLTVMLWVYMWTMLALFGNFYVKNYGQEKTAKIVQKSSKLASSTNEGRKIEKEE
ncbi:hypothetical protein MIR68_004648 [Amoeboaphelidium protococcarum]|nr:hypothetical protein MIR68_004648 [Amoeboaphelidium protococcarum]